ncbi:MAG: molybdate ABC transporter substrate-binding protein [Jaaginema sp. PMC 1079.18]|nr:molybdate ABC transporter substrate-binding protein [Jaaginema sp. PMC 1080.18]MEC4853403.1 molybdate ABC transporter substrate-binding protein [Jaaginema sp. PMC 1079.18]MEC4866438.1 molybdate ABC transporter substrate-binding protein [Jaaginema sp. PMC 1078.18]
MKIQYIWQLIGISLLVSCLSLGCDRSSLQQTIVTENLTISAAASLKNVLVEIQSSYQQKYPHTQVTYNFAASGTLQRQIEQGAPVDVFITAAASKMDILEQKGLIASETRRNFLKNKLVLVVPKVSKKAKTITNFPDLATAKITTIALGEPKSVPAGQYAQEVLAYFQIADLVNAKAVYGKDVRQVLNYVATGNVDAAIVYFTDVKASDRVTIVATAPENSHSPIIYAIAVVQDSKNSKTARQWIEFLNNPTAQTIFTRYGFLPNQ